MTTDPPPPGSAWARCCPDAYPPEWAAAQGLTALPPGYTRFADAGEVALITGAAPPPQPEPPPNAAMARQPIRKPPRPAAKPVPGRFADLNAFVDVSMRGLSRAAALTWLVLYRDTRPGRPVRTGQADIAARVGISTRAVRSGLRELEAAGLAVQVTRGRPGRGPSAYRVKGQP